MKSAELVENRICQNISTIQLNGGVNNEPLKLQPTSSPATVPVGLQPATTTETSEAEPPEQEGYRLLRYPKDKSCFAQFTWLIIWPIHLLFRIAIPDCKKPKHNKIFPLTFVMCIVWIGSLSYVVAWMITIIGR